MAADGARVLSEFGVAAEILNLSGALPSSFDLKLAWLQPGLGGTRPVERHRSLPTFWVAFGKKKGNRPEKMRYRAFLKNSRLKPSRDMKEIIGIDIGGTAVKAGIVSRKGHPAKGTLPFDPQNRFPNSLKR